MSVRSIIILMFAISATNGLSKDETAADEAVAELSNAISTFVKSAPPLEAKEAEIRIRREALETLLKEPHFRAETQTAAYKTASQQHFAVLFEEQAVLGQLQKLALPVYVKFERYKRAAEAESRTLASGLSSPEFMTVVKTGRLNFLKKIETWAKATDQTTEKGA